MERMWICITIYTIALVKYIATRMDILCDKCNAIHCEI